MKSTNELISIGPAAHPEMVDTMVKTAALASGMTVRHVSSPITLIRPPRRLTALMQKGK